MKEFRFILEFDLYWRNLKQGPTHTLGGTLLIGNHVTSVDGDKEGLKEESSEELTFMSKLYICFCLYYLPAAFKKKKKKNVPSGYFLLQIRNYVSWYYVLIRLERLEPLVIVLIYFFIFLSSMCGIAQITFPTLNLERRPRKSTHLNQSATLAGA